MILRLISCLYNKNILEIISDKLELIYDFRLSEIDINERNPLSFKTIEEILFKKVDIPIAERLEHVNFSKLNKFNLENCNFYLPQNSTTFGILTSNFFKINQPKFNRKKYLINELIIDSCDFEGSYLSFRELSVDRLTIKNCENLKFIKFNKNYKKKINVNFLLLMNCRLLTSLRIPKINNAITRRKYVISSLQITNCNSLENNLSRRLKKTLLF